MGAGATQNIETRVEELGNLARQFMIKADEQVTASKARQAEIDEILKKISNRMDEIETKASRPFGAPGSTDEEKQAIADRELKKAWISFMRKGGASPEAMKALATDSDEAGGILVPKNVGSTVIEKLVEFSPIRKYASGETISVGDAWEEWVEGDTTFGTSTHGERGTPAETTSGTFGLKRIPVHIQYAEPRATQKMLDDTAWNVEAWINKKLSEQLGKQEGTWFVTGDGVNKPKGILSDATILAAAEEADGAALVHDDILDLMAGLPEFYANTARFFMKRSTKFALRKLRDLSGGAGTGQYLWQPSFQIGTPPTYDGHEVIEVIDMEAVAASAKVVLFGDMAQAYKFVDRQGLIQIRDNLTTKPFVKFYTTRRVGGDVIKPEAIRLLKMPA